MLQITKPTIWVLGTDTEPDLALQDIGMKVNHIITLGMKLFTGEAAPGALNIRFGC
jgi:hypothetical protein